MDSAVIILMQLVVWLGLAFLTARVASKRGRSPVLWGIFSLVAPLIGLIAALCLSKTPPVAEEKDDGSITTLSLNTQDDKPKSQGTPT